MIHLAKRGSRRARRSTASNAASRFTRKRASPPNGATGCRIARRASRRVLACAVRLLVLLKGVVKGVPHANANYDWDKRNLPGRVDIRNRVPVDIGVGIDPASKPDGV